MIASISSHKMPSGIMNFALLHGSCATASEPWGSIEPDFCLFATVSICPCTVWPASTGLFLTIDPPQESLRQLLAGKYLFVPHSSALTQHLHSHTLIKYWRLAMYIHKHTHTHAHTHTHTHRHLGVQERQWYGFEGKNAFAFSISVLHSHTHTHTAHTMI